MLIDRRAPGPACRFGYANPTPFLHDRLGFLRDMARRYGDICRFRLGLREIHFLADPDAVRRLLTVEHLRLRRSAVTQLTRAVFGASVFNADGELHRQQRRRMSPMLHARTLDRHGRLMAAIAHRHQADWRDGDRLDASRAGRHLALEIGSRALFGVDLASEADTIESAVSRLLGTMNRVDHPLHWLGWLLPTPENLRILRGALHMRRIAARTVTRASAACVSRDTLLGMLLDARDRGEVGTQLVRDEVSLLLIAGHEMTAQALAWTLYLLGRHPDIQARIQDEVDRLCGDARPELAVVAAAPTLGNAIKESLRLYPPSPIFDRYTSSELDIGEHRIPAGRTVFVSPYITQRDERYFPDPDRFDPDRWATGDPTARSAYFPFGVGARRCLGEAFALAEIAVVLAVILQRWTLHFDDVAPVEAEALVTLRPRREIRLRLVRRDARVRAMQAPAE